jgi:hypothetical protein
LPDKGYRYHYGQLSGNSFEEALKANLRYKSRGKTRNDQLLAMLGEVTCFLGLSQAVAGKTPIPTRELSVMEKIIEAMLSQL